MTIFFWVCAAGAVYSYLLYPLFLMLVPKRVAGTAAQGYAPRVTIVVACRNEQRRLRHKLTHTLETRYPQREVIVASDASDDGSDDIVREYAAQGVRLVRSPERRGKEHAQGLAIEAAAGEIIVFTDAGTDLAPDSIDHLVDSFRDPAVGAVSSEDLFVSSDGKVAGEGAYVRYEMWLRQLESARRGLVGLSGSFFAVRRSLVTSWDPTIPSDFTCALLAARAGLVAISDARVRGIYKDVADPSAEYGRKVRTAIRGMTAVLRNAQVLNPFRFGAFAFQVWSHKVMRWLVPWFMLGALLSSWFLSAASPIYGVFFWLQVAGYAAVALAHWLPALRNIGPVRIGYYFVQVNLALAAAALQFVAGKRVVVWNPSTR
jgi:cellulose synthase/poly-beta-1,6-N-acetylglucosamine synthase-like glycosyltransferase